uniref:Taperin n=1 Tax=Kryptolebias marmoratus TaxID=37003 RepID=A0A3Q3AJY2_KRYMA
MSGGGGDVRVLRQEAGQESPRMPAWKREILERRKAKGGGSAEDGRESLVLQESLGPLEENPFIKLEKERRRRQDRESTARPVQHILELYGSVPGIRTIRAENIIIIESDPDYFPEAGGAKSGIRAKEVDVPRDSGPGQGRVSRILQKFDSNYGKLQKKSHSTENLLDLDCSASSRPRLWSKPQPDLVPKPRPGPPAGVQPTSPVFQSPWSSKAKPQPAVSEPGGSQSHPGAPQSVSSYRQRFEDRGVNGAAVVPRDEPDRGPNKLPGERDWEGSEASPKPKVPCSPETRRAESPLLPVSSKALKSSPEFEIRPSVKPDLDQIPDGDAQARALANLRLQSRNSFTVIPKRRLQTPPLPPDPSRSSPSHRAAEASSPGVPTSRAPTAPLVTTKRREEKKEPEPPPAPAATSPEPSPPSPLPSPAPSSPPVLISPPSSPAVPSSPVPSPSPAAPDGPTADHLPVTNIDDIEVEPPQRVHVPSPMVQKKKGNTFTVVPKRSPEPQKSPPEPQREAPSEASPGSTSPQAPFAQLGSQLKKRYPAVEEIQVIGGYQSLAKSCLSKTGSAGRKVRTTSFSSFSLRQTCLFLLFVTPDRVFVRFGPFMSGSLGRLLVFSRFWRKPLCFQTFTGFIHTVGHRVDVLRYLPCCIF